MTPYLVTFCEMTSVWWHMNAFRVICWNAAVGLHPHMHIALIGLWNCRNAANTETPNFTSLDFWPAWGSQTIQISIQLTIKYQRSCKNAFTRYPHHWWTETSGWFSFGAVLTITLSIRLLTSEKRQRQWCSPRDQGLGLEAPRGQKW